MVGRWTRYPLSYVEQFLRLRGTLGVDAGLGSDGVHIGTSPEQNIDFAAQNDGGTVTDYTTEINEATANDVLPFPTSPAAEDYFNFGQLEKWYGADLTIGTQANMTATTIWEYPTDDTPTWATLTPTLDETTILQVAGTGSKKLRFEPPSDWCPIISGITDDTNLYYQIRCRISAFTSSTTEPLISIGDIYTLTDGIGWKSPIACTLKTLKWTAGTVSGSTADSKFLVINLTQGTCGIFTLTKALSVGEYGTDIDLGVSEDDQLIIVQIQEDGITEFADVDLYLAQRV